MKFCKSERQFFEVSQYNPGPGYYSINRQISLQPEMQNDLFEDQQPLKNQQEQSTNWAISDRFSREAAPKQATPGVGTYNFRSQFAGGKPRPKTPQLMKSSKSLASNRSNLLSIPSIPSKFFSGNYHQIGNELLVLMKQDDNLKSKLIYQLQGYCTPKYTLTKPSVRNCVIKPPTEKPKPSKSF